MAANDKLGGMVKWVDFQPLCKHTALPWQVLISDVLEINVPEPFDLG